MTNDLRLGPHFGMLLKHAWSHVFMDLGVAAVTEQLVGIAGHTKAHTRAARNFERRTSDLHTQTTAHTTTHDETLKARVKDKVISPHLRLQPLRRRTWCRSCSLRSRRSAAQPQFG
jgi:hypothetical protein